MHTNVQMMDLRILKDRLQSAILSNIMPADSQLHRIISNHIRSLHTDKG